MRNDEILISSGVTAFTLKARENKVSPVLVLVVVQYDHSTLGNSSAHHPLCASSFAFRVWLIILLMTSTWPLACGWFGVEKCFLIPNFSQKFTKRALSNCFVLLVTIE